MNQVMQKHASKLRFAVVGAVNTGIDFGLLFGLVGLGLDKIPANLASTTIAFTFSFFANKSFTFRDTSRSTPRTVALFVGITLVGLWVIQPMIISPMFWLLSLGGLAESLSLLGAKLCATVVTLIWNYTLYSRYVFNTRGHDRSQKPKTPIEGEPKT